MVRSRAALHHALLALIVARSFGEITVRDIATQAGVGYATFFRHYPSKEALLEDAAADQIRQLVSMFLPVRLPIDTHASCVALCKYVDQHRGLWSALLRGGAQHSMRDELARVSMEVAGTVSNANKWLPAELGVAVTASSTVEILSWWLRQPVRVPVKQVAQILDRLVMAPLHRSG